MKTLKYGVILLIIMALWGCGKGNSASPVTIDPVTKKHPAGWAVNVTGGTHPDAYFANATSCEECHGKLSDSDGGISKVSCSNPGRSGVACHAKFPHIEGFAAYALHGNSADSAAIGLNGMAHCQKCHGNDYTGKGEAVSCIGCHKLTTPATNAPHAANWASYLGNARGLNHGSSVKESNAPACAQCHANKNNLSAAGKVRVAAFTTPGTGGCFNNSLCHNQAGHAFTVADHMVAARSKLADCQSCHATPVSGSNPRFTVQKNATLTPGGCEKCHTQAGLAHPHMWLPGRNGIGADIASHANAGDVNVSCGLCHGGAALTGATVNGIVYPSCFSNPMTSISGTTCHFSKPVDVSGLSVGCVSCHVAGGSLPATTTTTHNKHLALAGVFCESCHLGAVGIASHANGTISQHPPVTIKSAFNAKSGTALFVPAGGSGTCTNVSCHGGQPTQLTWANPGNVRIYDPADAATCLNCHKSATAPGASQFNDYFSGKPVPVSGVLTSLHDFHPSQFGVICTQCHTMSIAAGKHFDNLPTGASMTSDVAKNTLVAPPTLLQYTLPAATCSTASFLPCHFNPANDPSHVWR